MNISDLKSTALGEGYFITERVEYLDQNEALFAEALITYFQYLPASTSAQQDQPGADKPSAEQTASGDWHSDFSDRPFKALSVGDSLPELSIPVTAKLIVAGAIATQDFIDGHHNVAVAKASAMPDIFMNILTTSGLSARYLSDWAGPASRLKSLKFKLMSPNVPGDCMTLQGRISELNQQDGENIVGVDFAGKNSLGFHVTGSATLALND